MAQPTGRDDATRPCPKLVEVEKMDKQLPPEMVGFNRYAKVQF